MRRMFGQSVGSRRPSDKGKKCHKMFFVAFIYAIDNS